jgi:glycosyltransferase involved in cell wall biosynthesis
MKILWVRSELLRPLYGGGQILNRELLRHLHKCHEIHFVAYNRDHNVGGLDHSDEYCTYIHAIDPPPPPPAVLRPYVLEVGKSFLNRLPRDPRTLRTAHMRHFLAEKMKSTHFDALVCDAAYMVPNLPSLKGWVVLQENVESVLIRRRVQFEKAALVRLQTSIDADRMASLERKLCWEAAHVIALSEHDANTMRELFGAKRITSIHTGVDTQNFARPATFSGDPKTDMVFVGQMGWPPNVDGAVWFIKEVLPLIRRQRPECSLAIVGHKPDPSIREVAANDPLVNVTGTVDDVRPWLWGTKVAVVPIRFGSGIRIKIYEAMAAGTPVVSTTLGAEGLPLRSPEDLRIADEPAAMADACLQLLANEAERLKLAAAAETLVRENFDWSRTAKEVEAILMQARAQSA